MFGCMNVWVDECVDWRSYWMNRWKHEGMDGMKVLD
jgi:hypothetical protein